MNKVQIGYRVNEKIKREFKKTCEENNLKGKVLLTAYMVRCIKKYKKC